MPECISVGEYLRITWDDHNSPTTSNFVPRMGHCRNTAAALEEAVDCDRSGITKMKKSVKALYSSGTMHVSNEMYLAENLEKLGTNALTIDQIPEIGAAFLKFAVVTKELSGLMKNLMTNLNRVLMFPLDSFLKGDLRGVKGDLKKPFDKANKEYETKFNKIEKEKKHLAKEAGMVRTEVTGPEIAEDMEKERRLFQLQMCEYLIKVNEIRTKKGVDLLQHLVEYYQAQTNYFADGMKTIEHFKAYIEDLVGELAHIKQRQDADRRELVELRDALRASMSTYKELQLHHSLHIPNHKQHRHSTPATSGYSLHQLQGNKIHGFERQGHLLKKSEGVRKVWQRRKCKIKEGFIYISHSDVTKEPVKLNLLTCQVKLIPDDPGKKCFDLISSSKNRTYHFQAEDIKDMEEWISVLNNAKEAVLMQAFGQSESGSKAVNQSVKELTGTIMAEVKRLPGNQQCCDCGAPDPEWLSVNLGVLICLECCGVHREMGVHISRTQSTVIDDLGTSKLLLARVVSNRGFNDIMEATLDVKYKPTKESTMEEKKEFIYAKYEKRRFAILTCTNNDDRKTDLKQAVSTKDILALIQVYAEGMDFMEPLSDMDNSETALHLAIAEEDGTSLHMVDFLLQNSNSQHLQQATRDGDTALHLCARLNRTECMKLLLRVRPDLCDIENGVGLTALEIAKKFGHETCIELLNHGIAGKTELFENVNIDWNLIADDHLYDNVDYSDDDLDSITTPDRKARSRPGSVVAMSTEALQQAQHSRASSMDSNKSAFLLAGQQKHQKYIISGTATLPKKKAPAPLPPNSLPGPGSGFLAYGTISNRGHSRHPSEPSFGNPKSGHVRSPSDPPVISKTGSAKGSMPGKMLSLALFKKARQRMGRGHRRYKSDLGLASPSLPFSRSKSSDETLDISPEHSKSAWDLHTGYSPPDPHLSQSMTSLDCDGEEGILDPCLPSRSSGRRATIDVLALAGEDLSGEEDSSSREDLDEGDVMMLDEFPDRRATLAEINFPRRVKLPDRHAERRITVDMLSPPCVTAPAYGCTPLPNPTPAILIKGHARSYSDDCLGVNVDQPCVLSTPHPLVEDTPSGSLPSSWTGSERRNSQITAFGDVPLDRVTHQFPQGAKLVLPPPPEFGIGDADKLPSPTDGRPRSASSEKPDLAPKPLFIENRSLPMTVPKSLLRYSAEYSSGFLTDSYNGQSQSMDSLDSLDSAGGLRNIIMNPQPGGPIPTPRQKRKSARLKRCRALYDCDADNEDELSFMEGEILVVLREEEDEWWEGHVEGRPDRRGMFPATFVEVLPN